MRAPLAGQESQQDSLCRIDYGHARKTCIKAAMRELRAGRMIVIVDNEDRENEGDLMMAADGSMARVPALVQFCRTRKLEMITISGLVRYRSTKNNDGPSGAIEKVTEAVA